MAKEPITALAPLPLTRRVNLLRTAVAFVACWPGACRVVALVDLGVGITELDRNVSLQLVLEAHSLDFRDSLDNSRFSYQDESQYFLQLLVLRPFHLP